MKSVRARPRLSYWKAGLVVGAMCISGAGGAAELAVRVGGLSEAKGQVGCSLFDGAAGFPMDNATARVVWLPANIQGVTCRFVDVPEGRYAVSVVNDLDGNKRVTTNFVGLPIEPWGVSNNARPVLRAPRFDEASFMLAADKKNLVVDVTVAK
jgi:uncharacterized protein (DUF2141 family)